MKNLLLIFLVASVLSCENNSATEPKTESNHTEKTTTAKPENAPKLDLEQAQKLAVLPLNCIGQEYPNKLSQVISSDADLLPPTVLHPAFYGCFDWHSSVHGHWSLVRLLKLFPEMEGKDSVVNLLLAHISEENINAEVEYFFRVHENTFERTYGWAWLLKLAEELHTWDNENARVLEQNLQPLTNLIVTKYIEYLPKLNYPIRVGTHGNTAFGLTFAHDYAVEFENDSLRNLIGRRAKDFYLKDTGCPLRMEPGGYDFLSPCLEEVDIMRRVLPAHEFDAWLEKFLPQLANPNFYLKPGIVSDRTDGHLVHLDGVNFSRAWCFYGLANSNKKFAHLRVLANEHIKYSLPNLVADDYMGGHWLASFAIMALP